MGFKKILIVDDEEHMRKLLYTELSLEGYQVIQAQNGAEAIDKAKKHKPGLILMDFMLPDMTGADTVKMLQNDPLTKEIPLLFLTALVSKQEEKQDGFGIQVNNIRYESVSKELNTKEFLDKVRAMVKG